MSATERRLAFKQRTDHHKSAPDHTCDGTAQAAKSFDKLNSIDGGARRLLKAVRGQSVDCNAAASLLVHPAANSSDGKGMRGSTDGIVGTGVGVVDRLNQVLSGEMFNVFFSIAKDNIPSTSLPSIGVGVAGAGSTRDHLVTTVYRQYRARARMLEPYRRLKNALKHLQDAYLESKEHNMLHRYAEMRGMIHEVVLLEKQYWQLIDIPKQEMTETPNEYVMRVINLLDARNSRTSMSAQAQPVRQGAIASLLGATVNIAERTKDQNLFEAIKAKSSEELRKESVRLNTELYRLIHKYQNLRGVVRELSDSFQDTRFYPIVPRYPLLKTMIKRVLRAPAFAEVCHEVNE